MNFCPNCGHAVDETMKCCQNCGEAVNQSAPVYPIPAKPGLPVKVKVKGYVGMGISIDALVASILGVYFTMVCFLASLGVYLGEGVGIGFISTIFGWLFGVITLPVSIVGRILCRNSLREGNTSKACSAGAKLGLAGIILSVVTLVLGIAGLFLM